MATEPETWMQAMIKNTRPLTDLAVPVGTEILERIVDLLLLRNLPAHFYAFADLP
jgi:hypothetical protein